MDKSDIRTHDIEHKKIENFAQKALKVKTKLTLLILIFITTIFLVAFCLFIIINYTVNNYFSYYYIIAYAIMLPLVILLGLSYNFFMVSQYLYKAYYHLGMPFYKDYKPKQIYLWWDLFWALLIYNLFSKKDYRFTKKERKNITKFFINYPEKM